MNVETIREAILNLSPPDRARLMAEVGPELCQSVMQTPGLMERMMPRCEEMMQDPELQKSMRPMMERMMKTMMERMGKPPAGGERHG
jgi:DNA-binding transcriptional regulator YbjK